MPRPRPTPLYHFTHVTNLPSVVVDGLLCESAGTPRCSVEIGNRSIKDQRRRRRVPVGAGGVVSDYTPLYFAPRSPMLFAINGGQVPEYSDGQDPLVYLVTTVERVTELGLTAVFTDRNAALGIAQFTADIDGLDDLVDWTLMRARYWANTPDDPGRRERRMAECLVHPRVPWGAFIGIGVRDRMRRDEARSLLAAAGATINVEVHPNWYF